MLDRTVTRWRTIVLLGGLFYPQYLGAIDPPAPNKVIPPTRDNGSNTGPTTPDRVLPNEPPHRKNYWIPALEIPTFQFLLNQADRAIYGPPTYNSTFASGWDHVKHGPWVVDQDAFTVNQIGHPYQGSVYYGLARSSGLNFWEGWLYSNYGSLIWETYGETTKPSINDQVASGTAGAVLGEALYRMSNLVMEDRDTPSLWRKWEAAFISPPTGFNRLVFGESYTPILEKRNPATFSRGTLGGGISTTRSSKGAGADDHATGIAEFSMDYGQPGQPGYRYLRPFDYFNFDLKGQLEGRKPFESVSTRGLLFGDKYDLGDDCRGVWGLFGSFDYLSPEVFRISMTGASLGSTGQWWLGKEAALQGSALAGMAYGAAGTVSADPAEPDYHYGATPMSLVALRLILGNRVMLDSTARGYYISDTGASKAPGLDNIGLVDSSILFRIVGHHSVGLHYTIAVRDARYDSGARRNQQANSVILAYNYVSDLHFGAVNWGR